VSTTVVLPRPAKKDIRELAWRRRTSVSALVTAAVERLLEEAREAGELEAVA